ncbi:carbamoyl-phosphate synthase large subunit [Actinoallomurus rhizosphaericola]|uniref:carbamoyl-phosphate synthase large subunit n=1 Tax=Actinoallomurus rhizosphaericola TaxID=2952536 RepID=UPI002092BAAD|nr:carbamoyl-phosphate synthase large subunit [Actinoallomurus rhizosphaericola]MCO5998841.1 carbamoyl-phosphate synthase large subunit [Actinoallomurus rhizosphaericola]
MPRRDDLSSILVIGSGPIVIGQACEFDYSGAQACRALREDGYRVILANSNPATIMTDPEFADRTYLEPLTAEFLTAIIERERPDAVLATLGGQTALNLATELHRDGVLDRYGVEMIGANADAIRTAETRELFKKAMTEIGLEVPASGFAHGVDEALAVGERIGYPVMVRPSYILGGAGTGIADDADALARLAEEGIAASPAGEILIEESIAGWKEYELEVMRDRADNCVVICSIENLDPVGVHTGDSITVAPAQTLSDVEYQRMRDAAFACIRRIGVETGGSNIQFAIDPRTGRMVVIEMNPRVSRSSALASKATGFPIAKIATLLAVGYTLDEIRNDITRETPAAFEPTIDYVVTKVPRWGFEKFSGVADTLGTRMRSVGEAMAIGRTFPESLQKGLRSLDNGRLGLNADPAEADHDGGTDEELLDGLSRATPDRIFRLEAAVRRGIDLDRIHGASAVDPWFLDQIAMISAERVRIADGGIEDVDWRRAKRLGFADAQIAYLLNRPEEEVRRARLAAGVRATFKTVDTCAAEFEAHTPYYYSTWEDTDEVRRGDKPRVVILGSGPNRIGQGVEFDYCCVQASGALREAGFETVMVNCNPETVSTDYDTSDRLYFEPLTAEDIQNVLDAEEPVGVIVTFGGQTPLKLADRLPSDLVLGTDPDAIDLAEDRERWNALCARLGIDQPAGGTAGDEEEAFAVADRLGYPVLFRPSYVLSGRAMRVVHDAGELRCALADLRRDHDLARQWPVLIDRFLAGAVEVDVDAVRDADGEVLIGAVMEHIEPAGVHSGDSACAIPPMTLSGDVVAVIERHTRAIADALGVCGPLNVQYAVDGDRVYVIEANPRASRTVPFASKATGVPLARLAARVLTGATLAGLRDEGLLRPPARGAHCVKEAVLPFDRLPEAADVLGPEMRSTGEVMGVDGSFGTAYAKSQIAAGAAIPADGRVYLAFPPALADEARAVARRFADLGFAVTAPPEAARALALPVVEEADGPPAAGEDGVRIVVDVPENHAATLMPEQRRLRDAARRARIPYLTTLAAAEAFAVAVASWRVDGVGIRSLQEHHGAAAR